MARVVGPLYSLQASGSFGDLITYKCGTIACKKKKESKFYSNKFNQQREKFKAGAEVWRSIRGFGALLAWGSVGIVDRYNLMCNHVPVALALFGILNPIDLVTLYPAAVLISGYQLFMSYYLTFGEDGWPNYPFPPPGDWKPQ